MAAIEYEAAGNYFGNASVDSQAKAAYNKAAQTISEVLTNSLNNKTCNFADNNISKRAIYSHYENAKVYVRIGDLHAKAGNYQESMKFYELAHNAYYVCYTYAELVHEKNSLVKSMLELSNKIVDNEIAIYHLEQPPIASDTQQENTQIRSAEYESQQANHNTELISSVELPFTKADAYASIELAIDRLLETVTSSSFTHLEISQAIKNLGTRLQDNYFLLNKQQKTVLYEKLNTMLEQHKVCFISKLSHGNYLVVEQLFNLISSLVTTKTLNADEIKITHYDTRKIISRSFSQRYFHLIRMHGKEDIKNQCIEIKSELEKLSTDKDKMAYINLMLKNHKEIAELLSNPRYSSETEQLFILSERINIICDTLNLPDDVTNPTSKYTESVTWYQWIRHVGLLTRVSTKSNEFFSIAPAIEEFGNFESVPVHMALNIENDANYQKSPPYAGFSLPIAGSKSDAGSRSEKHQYFGIFKHGLLEGRSSFIQSGSSIHNGREPYYQFLSEEHNCVGAANLLLKFGLVTIFTKLTLRPTELVTVNDPVNSLAYLYDISRTICNINEKCHALEEWSNFIPLTNEEINSRIMSNTNDFITIPTEAKFIKLIKNYNNAKQAGEKLKQLEILKEMVEKSYENLSGKTFCNNPDNKLFIQALLSEIQIVYANKEGRLLKSTNSNSIKSLKLMAQQYAGDVEKFSRKLKDKYLETPNVVIQLLKELYLDQPESFALALQSAYPDGIPSQPINRSLINIISEIYFNYPDQIVLALKKIYPNPEQFVPAIITKYSDNPNMLVPVLQIIYPNQPEKVMEIITTAYFNNPNMLVVALQIIYPNQLAKNLKITTEIYKDNQILLSQSVLQLLSPGSAEDIVTILQANYESNSQVMIDIAKIIFNHDSEKFSQVLNMLYHGDLEKINATLVNMYVDDPEKFALALKNIYSDNSEKILQVLVSVYKNRDDDSTEFAIALDTIYSGNPKQIVKILKSQYIDNIEKVIQILTELYQYNPEQFGLVLAEVYPNQPQEIIPVLQRVYLWNLVSIKKALTSAFIPNQPELFIQAVNFGFNNDSRVIFNLKSGLNLPPH